jgi:hypothetical protein
MTLFLTRRSLTSLLSLLIVAVPASQAAAQARPRINPPPSADLAYTIKARQGGLTISGNALVQWTTGPGKYSVVTETRAMLVGKILDEKSEGAIDQYGLAPVTFTEKRFRKEATTASFDRPAKKISFTDSTNTYPIKGGEQDRASAVWQLISVARGTPARFKTGSSWTFFVAGQQDAEPWTFKVGKREKIRTPLGEMNALHVVKAPPPNTKGQQVDIWLAPSLEWYPVRLRIADDKGEYIEQTLETVTRK